uniref:EamA domain-containing protein n=1 Tax=Amphora coffeiformis TaxID=265554 RepID=A0A7S3PBC1_9STRA
MASYFGQLMVAVAGGLAAGLQSPFAGIMGQKTHEVTSVFFTYGLGALLASLLTLILVLVQKNDTDNNNNNNNNKEMLLENWRDIPWYAFLAGPMGLVVVGSISYTTPRLGATTSTTVFVLVWLCFAAVVDHFGWFDVPMKSIFNVSRLLGIRALILGTWLVVKD